MDEILWFYDIQVTDKKFIDKPCNLLVFMNNPKTKSGVKTILKDSSDFPKVLRLEVSGTLKVLRIYQYSMI